MIMYRCMLICYYRHCHEDCAVLPRKFSGLFLYTMDLKYHKPLDLTGNAKRLLCISRVLARLFCMTWNRLVDKGWVMYSLPLRFSDTSVY